MFPNDILCFIRALGILKMKNAIAFFHTTELYDKEISLLLYLFSLLNFHLSSLNLLQCCVLVLVIL